MSMFTSPVPKKEMNVMNQAVTIKQDMKYGERSAKNPYA